METEVGRGRERTNEGRLPTPDLKHELRQRRRQQRQRATGDGRRAAGRDETGGNRADTTDEGDNVDRLSITLHARRHDVLLTAADQLRPLSWRPPATVRGKSKHALPARPSIRPALTPLPCQPLIHSTPTSLVYCLVLPVPV